MKFEIKDRFSAKVLFTAEIETSEGDTYGVRMGKAVRAAVAARADLRMANLYGADLRGAYLYRADLYGADLYGADLSGAYLSRAYLSRANLSWADLRGANLSRADLSGAYLSRADLSGVRSLERTTGLNRWIKCLQLEEWPVTYTAEVMQIGCQKHTLEAWMGFSDAEIRQMDALLALKFWTKWKEWLFRTIEMAPAEPTKAAPAEPSTAPSEAA